MDPVAFRGRVFFCMGRRWSAGRHGPATCAFGFGTRPALRSQSRREEDASDETQKSSWPPHCGGQPNDVECPILEALLKLLVVVTTLGLVNRLEGSTCDVVGNDLGATALLAGQSIDSIERVALRATPQNIADRRRTESALHLLRHNLLLDLSRSYIFHTNPATGLNG